VPDPEFALHRHLHHHRVRGAGDLDELLGVAERIATTPFDRTRPPWEATLVAGLAEGRAGYVLKVHHSLVDGVGLVQILDMLHARERDPVPAPDVPPPAADATDDPSRRSRGGLTSSRALGWARAAPAAALDAALRGARRARSLAAHPATTAVRVGIFAGSALRAALPDQGRGSSLLAGRSLERRFLTLDVDLAELKAAGRAAGGSVNDAFVAAVLGALRDYHARFGRVPASVPTGMPISTRTRSDPMGGNHWAGTRFAAPLDEPDPGARIARVHEIVRDLTGERVVDGLGLIAPLLAALPSPLLSRIQGAATRGNDLQVSNFPGLDRPSYLAGARILRTYPLVPLPGGALMVALMSHEGTCCIGATLDPAAVVDPELFGRCLRTAFDEVVVSAGGR